jgi:hypothetical protein
LQPALEQALIDVDNMLKKEKARRVSIQKEVADMEFKQHYQQRLDRYTETYNKAKADIKAFDKTIRRVAGAPMKTMSMPSEVSEAAHPSNSGAAKATPAGTVINDSGASWIICTRHQLR